MLAHAHRSGTASPADHDDGARSIDFSDGDPWDDAALERLAWWGADESAMPLDVDERESIPAGLDEMEPGLLLAAILSATDVARLSGHDKITFLRAQQRMASHYAAQMYASMAAVAEHMRSEDDYEGDPLAATEAAACEIRAALRLTRRATDAELSFALELRERLPDLWHALTAGDVDVRRARVISAATSHLSMASARTLVGEILPEACRMTTGQLGAHIRRLCVEVDPDDAKDRYGSASEQRRVAVEPTVDGTAHLSVFDGAPDRVARAMDRINRIARSLRSDGEQRTMDQLRADVVLDLLSGTRRADSLPRSGRGVVDLTVDLETLAGLAEAPGDLGGYGPVIADIARRVADESHEAEWRWTIVDPKTGRPVGGGLTRRRPAAAQRRQIERRDRTCVFPGCRMPATACDLDHTVPWAEGGPTGPANQGPLCRHDHRSRHRHGWRYRRLPDGDYEWTTRLGHRYTASGRPP